MNHRGETRELAAIAQPTIVVVNNAQREHQEFMASVAEVAAEHADAIAALPRGGMAVVNADDAHADVWRDAAHARGRARRRRSRSIAPADVHAPTARRAPTAATLDARDAAGPRASTLAVPGRHMARNALAATAAALAAGAALRGDRAGLAASARCRDGCVALRAAHGARRDRRHVQRQSRFDARGDRRARGGAGHALARDGRHGRGRRRRARVPPRDRRVRARARHRRACTRSATRRAKRSPRSARAPRTSRDVTRSRRRSRATRDAGVTVLVKGSRFMRMERVVAALTGRAARRRPLMLLLLTEWLAQYVRTFNVFGYITLRAVLATMTALVISFVVGPRMIAWLTRMKIGQSVRDDGPQTHLAKAGTPTMGGALILVSIVVTTLLWGDLDQPLRLGRAARHAGLRRRRLGRRLAQGRLPQSEGAVRAREVLLAVGDRAHRRDLSRVLGLRARQHAVRAAALRVGAKRLHRRRCRRRRT